VGGKAAFGENSPPTTASSKMEVFAPPGKNFSFEATKS
jgi:hypothetical protein